MKKPRPPLEREIVADIRAVFARIPWVTIWVNRERFIAKPNGETAFVPGLCEGSSDLIGIVAPTGRIIAIEVKRPGERPRLDQITFMRRIRDMGGVAGWCVDVIGAIDLLLEARDACTKRGALGLEVNAAIQAMYDAKARKRRGVRVA